jgi:hypothetical protein
LGDHHFDRCGVIGIRRPNNEIRRKRFGWIGRAPKRKEIEMLKRSLVIAVLGATVATGTLSTAASAQGDPVLGGLIGAGIGAAIGHSVNGSNGAWVGGALGAVTGATIAAGSGGYYGNGYYAPSPGYAAPGYYGGGAAYYAPAPAYYAPPAVVYRPRPVVYVQPYAPRYVAPRWGYGNWRNAGHNYGRPTPYAYGQGH